MIAGPAMAQETLTGPFLLDPVSSGFLAVWQTDQPDAPDLTCRP